MNKVALVIGGSGMLAGACKELAKQYSVVGVVGRTKSKMQNLQHVQNIVPVYADYSNLSAFENALAQFAAEHGKPSLVVSWVHSTSPEAPQVVAKYCTHNLYEVAGTSDKQQAMTRQTEAAVKKLGLNYHRVTLGHMGERWLTDQEISGGVLRAISKGGEHLIGKL